MSGSDPLKGVVARRKGADIEVLDIVVPDPGPGEALVAVETCGVGYAFSLGGLPTDSSSLGLLQWRTAENAILATLMVSSIGQVILQRGANGGPEIARSDVCIFPDSYQHFEAVRSPRSSPCLRVALMAAN